MMKARAYSYFFHKRYSEKTLASYMSGSDKNLKIITYCALSIVLVPLTDELTNILAIDMFPFTPLFSPLGAT